MTLSAQIVLVICASVGFAGGGIAAAVRTHRERDELPDDQGFAAITTILFLAGCLCADVAGGLTAIAALALPLVCAGYLSAAQRLGLFSIETGPPRVRMTAETELHT